MRATARHCGLATLAVILLALELTPLAAAAQPIERPTNCTEALSSATIFIGHDCGEWASVVIAGNIIIRKPWSRANPASRAVRIRERRDGISSVVPEPTHTSAPTTTPSGDCHSDYVERLPIVDDLDCGDLPDLRRDRASSRSQQR
jgi:hypothetical protein